MNGTGGVSGRVAWAAVLLATAVGAGWSGPAAAQGQQPGNTSIGPDALRGFSLPAQNRIVTQPATPPAPAPTLPPPPTAQPSAATPLTSGSRPVPNRPAPTAAPRAVQQQPVRTTPGVAVPAPRAQEIAAPAPVDQAVPPAAAPSSTPPPTAAPAPAAEPSAATPAAPAAPAAPSNDWPWWVYGLSAAMLALGAFLFLRRRRAAALALPAPEDFAEETAEPPVPQPSLPRVPRPDPVPRPWIELDLVAERATADAQESFVEFALTIRNSGGSTARNLKLQAKLVCGTLTQDEEIAAFQRKKPGEHRTIPLPDLQAGEEITIQGRVDSKGEELKALRVEQKLLFIPLVVVNAFYDWNSSRTGQTSRSFLVGREKPDPSERMAPFRLDLGPRVYRTVGQRPYKIQKRV